MDLQSLRYEYKSASLDEADCDPNPIEQFRRWLADAVAAQNPEPNAMALATVSPNGSPSSRMVLLKAFDSEGFVFFTNFDSRKGLELASNNHAALLFYWGELERQVRIEGSVAQTSREVSESYFAKRPRSSQLGSACSAQSTVIQRSELHASYEKLATMYPESITIPCPAHWGGYIVRPTVFEFWQGRENRLHDRIIYEADAGTSRSSEWRRCRLAP